MGQENIAYERELGNINIRGKRGKKTVPFGIEPVVAEVDRGKIDESKAPDLFLDLNLPNIDVVGQDMSARPQATQETISKAHSIYDIEKEKQAVRDKEKAEANELGRLYVEGRRYGLDELMEEVNAVPHVDKPVVDENVPIIDTTLEKEALPNNLNTEKKESNPLDDYVKLVNDLWTKEDEEAAKKKQKAAQWILAAQMLGDSIGALSNVYWTGKGANAQKLEPGAQKAAATTYQLEQDIRNAREKAAKAKMDATLKKYEMEMQREREKKADERYASEQAESRRRYDEGMAYRRERDAKSDEQHKELLEFRRQQGNRIAKSSRGASTSTKDVEPIEFTLGDGETIGIDKFNKDKLNRLYRSLPEDVKSAIENEEVYSNGMSMGTKKRKVTDDDRLQAIYDNLDNPEVANAIRRLAGVEFKAANTEEPKSVVVKDAHGNEYSVNPDFPVLGAAPSSMQTDEAKKHLNGIVISTGKKPVWQ